MSKYRVSSIKFWDKDKDGNRIPGDCHIAHTFGYFFQEKDALDCVRAYQNDPRYSGDSDYRVSYDTV